MSVARVAVAGSVLPALDYWVPSNLDVREGSVVHVPLGPRRAAGVVVECAVASTIPRGKLRIIDAVDDELRVPGELLDVVRFVADYYQEPLGAVIAHALPPLATRGARERRPRLANHPLRLNAAGLAGLGAIVSRAPARRALYEALQREQGLAPAAVAALRGVARRALAEWREAGFVDAIPCADEARAPQPVLPALNAEQVAALAAIDAAAGRYAPWVLQGITGSGKTAVYLAAAAARIAAGGQVLMLVPEINLTPQLEDEVRAALPGVALATLHSGLAAGERRAHWLAAASGEARLVLGTRLAAFAPLPRLALVVVDEEHDPSYKQQDGVRYHARDVAIWRAHARGVPVVLGSATPSLETFHHAEEGRYGCLRLTTRARPGALPRIALVPSRVPDAHEGLVPALWTALRRAVAAGGQALVFVNRRGFAPALANAARAGGRRNARGAARAADAAPGAARAVLPPLRRDGAGARAMPDCGNVDLIPRGHGTQRLEAALEGAFGAGRVVRVDRDSMRAPRRVRVHARARRGRRRRRAGRHADAGQGPRLPAAHAGGRAGRRQRAVQRRLPGHRAARRAARAGGRAARAAPSIAATCWCRPTSRAPGLSQPLASGDYDAFARGLLAERAAAALPPYASRAAGSRGACARRRRRFPRRAHGRRAPRARRCSRAATSSTSAGCRPAR